jgi:hypothetical protein
MESIVRDPRCSDQMSLGVGKDARLSFSQLDIRIFLGQVSRFVVLGFIKKTTVIRPALVSAKLVKVEYVRKIVQRVEGRRTEPSADRLFDAVAEVT